MDRILELFKNDKFAENCGIQIAAVSPGYAKCTMEVNENHLNGIGTLMGGAAFTLADFAFGVAANSHGPLAVSLNANISFLAACNRGTITAIATEISRTKRIGVYKICITDENNKSIAEVTGTCYFKNS
jgi:acyl-CoA thioesterase